MRYDTFGVIWDIVMYSIIITFFTAVFNTMFSDILDTLVTEVNPKNFPVGFIVSTITAIIITSCAFTVSKLIRLGNQINN